MEADGTVLDVSDLTNGEMRTVRCASVCVQGKIHTPRVPPSSP